MHRQDRLAARISSTAAAATAAIAIVVLAGWAADVDAMQRLFIGRIHMLPITAVAFLAASASLLLQRLAPDETSWLSVVARGLAAIVLAIGALTFGERLFGWDAGIDQLLFPEQLRRLPYRPLGRMATNSTVALMLAGAALLSLDGQTRSGRRPAQALGTAGLAIASIALVGYIYGADSLYRFDAAAGMALASAVAFFLLHLGILASRPVGAVGVLFAEEGGGTVARRLLLAVSTVPLLSGWILVQARERDLVTRELGVAMLVVVVIATLLVVTLRSTALMQAGERARELVLEREAAARAEAEAANRAKNDFLAIMSHELRTPLNAIIGYGSLLADGIPDPVTEGQRRQLGRIASSARHLLALIDEVLTLSRMELGEERTTPTTIPVATVLEEAAVMVDPQARAKGLRFEVHLPEPALTMETDANRLRQALVNLLANAVKFTEHGYVRMRVAVDRDGETLTFTVEDSGVGIAPEHLGRVFDSFWQVDQATTRRAGGVGLGLHVTRRLVRLLGGEVTVSSAPGEGSCFTIRLPRHWWGSPQVITPTPTAVRGGRGARPAAMRE